MEPTVGDLIVEVRILASYSERVYPAFGTSKFASDHFLRAVILNHS